MIWRILPSLIAATLGCIHVRRRGHSPTARPIVALTALNGLVLLGEHICADEPTPFAGLVRVAWALSSAAFWLFLGVSVETVLKSFFDLRRAARIHGAQIHAVLLGGAFAFLLVAYPVVRGSFMKNLFVGTLRISAIMQLATVAIWAGKHKFKNTKLSIENYIGITFCAGAAWDLAGALAPRSEMIRDWWITQYGNVLFWSIICVIYAIAILKEYCRES